jgi:hypothetical protein
MIYLNFYRRFYWGVQVEIGEEWYSGQAEFMRPLRGQ